MSAQAGELKQDTSDQVRATPPSAERGHAEGGERAHHAAREEAGHEAAAVRGAGTRRLPLHLRLRLLLIHLRRRAALLPGSAPTGGRGDGNEGGRRKRERETPSVT